MAERDEIKSLKKALRAITFLNQRGDQTITEVARGIDVPRATAYRLLQTLASEGYVDKLPNSDLYRLTSLVRRLASGFQDEELLLEIARPLLAELQRELGWSLALATPRGTSMLVRLNTDHDSPLALVRYGIGGSVPMLHSTCGYCYLAHCPPKQRDALIEACINDSSSPAWKMFSRAQIDEQIEDVQAQGFCRIELDHLREGNLGVPLLLAGRPIGGLVMRYIKSTLRDTDRLRQFYAPRLQKLAREIAMRHPAQQPPAASIRGVNSGTAGIS